MLAQIDTRTGAGTGAARIFQDEGKDVQVVFWGRLDNKSGLAESLGMAPDAADSRFVAAAWSRWGERCPENLIGDFAFAVLDAEAGTLFLGRDVAGVKPLYYRHDAEGIVFATSVAAFKPLSVGTLRPCRKWMAEYLIDMSWSLTDTAFEGIKKLPPAHSLTVHRGGEAALREYFRFDIRSPEETRRDGQWLERYRDVWTEAVRCRLPATGGIASENSGGLDSASITSEIAHQLDGDRYRLHALGFCYQREEPEYIMATAMHWQLRHNLLFSHNQQRDWTQIQDRQLRVNGYPMEHGNGPSFFPIYHYCQGQGIGTLMSGFGGDEVATNPGGMPARFERIDAGDWTGLWDILQGTWPMKTARLVKTWRESRAAPQQRPYLLRAWHGRWPHRFLSDSAVAAFDLEKRYFASATYDERHRRINTLALDLISRPYPPVRLENCSLMASSFGIEYVWPFWDRRLMQQWFSTPSAWKVGSGGVGRFLHRSAVDGVCPPKVVWKPSKDMGYTDHGAAIAALDNRPHFRQALALLEDLPGELSEIVDVGNVRAMALRGIREDIRGADVNYAWSTACYRLESLCDWLRYVHG